ncbi:DUF4145 domain-containing protein [uncultured Treponema sp.]|uniref:DUF4145 domain-containing protein n=1 Tax=uncultured Treponema sp. TaxID=162155 RepID=UPI0025F0E4A9|nr:DUF4145 domain-containing protein [uncultured Treponema sp.]
MSIWREIWKESLTANSQMFFNKNNGEKKFKDLLVKYNNDGMLFYARGETYEAIGLKDKAIEDYKNAAEQFPVEHWKSVAKNTIKRVEQNKTAEFFFKKDDFNSYLWFLFQKIYEFVYIDDFVRYVCLSAVSRASSEWPLSLIDFRTILELQVNTLLDNKVKSYDFINTDLNQRIWDISNYGLITNNSIIQAMHWIRRNGNAATHDIKSIGDENKLLKLQSFYTVIKFLNEYNKLNGVKK